MYVMVVSAFQLVYLLLLYSKCRTLTPITTGKALLPLLLRGIRTSIRSSIVLNSCIKYKTNREMSFVQYLQMKNPSSNREDNRTGAPNSPSISQISSRNQKKPHNRSLNIIYPAIHQETNTIFKLIRTSSSPIENCKRIIKSYLTNVSV